MAGEGVRALVRGLGPSSPLRYLDMGGVLMGGNGTEALATWMLNPGVQIETLDISDNFLLRAGVISLGLLLQGNTSLRTLWMNNCVMTDILGDSPRHASRPLFDGLAQNKTLEALSLSIDGGHARTRVSLKRLVRALREHPRLTDLRIAGQLSWHEEVLPLCQFLASPTCRLRKLDISGAYIDSLMDWIALATAFGVNKRLRYLWMVNARIGHRDKDDEYQHAFFRLLEPNVTIRYFLDEGTAYHCGALVEWEKRNRRYGLRSDACKKAAIAILGLKRFRCPAWLRGYGRDIFTLLAQAIVQSRHDPAWSRLSGEDNPRNQPPQRWSRIEIARFADRPPIY